MRIAIATGMAGLWVWPRGSLMKHISCISYNFRYRRQCPGDCSGDDESPDAQHHQRVDPEPGRGRPSLHRALCALYGHGLRLEPLAIRPHLVPSSAVSHLCYFLCQHLHPHPHVLRQVPGSCLPSEFLQYIEKKGRRIQGANFPKLDRTSFYSTSEVLSVILEQTLYFERLFNAN